MSSRNYHIITWLVLCAMSYGYWRSSRQLHQAHTQIVQLESSLDSLQIIVTQYLRIEQAYTAVHLSLQQSHRQLEQLRMDLWGNATDHQLALDQILQQLDTVRQAYDTLQRTRLTLQIDHDLSFDP